MYYKGIRLDLIERNDYHSKKAKRFAINNTNQNIWVPNRHLNDLAEIKKGDNIDFLILRNWTHFTYAGVDLSCICGRKGWNFKKMQIELGKKIMACKTQEQKERYFERYDMIRRYIG